MFQDTYVIDNVVAQLIQKRRLPDFGNAGTVASMINVAKVNYFLTISLSEVKAAEKQDISPRNHSSLLRGPADKTI